MTRALLILVALAALTLIAPWAVLFAALALLAFGWARRLRAEATPTISRLLPGEKPGPTPLLSSQVERRFRVIAGGR